MNVCKNCGAPLNENNFCIRCGAGGDGTIVEKGIGQQYSVMDDELKTPIRRVFEESELVYGKPDFGMKFHNIYIVILCLHLFIGLLDGINLHIGYILFVAITTLLLFLRNKVGYLFNLIITFFYLIIGAISIVMGVTILTGNEEYKIILDISTTLGLYNSNGLYMLIFGIVLAGASFGIIKYYASRKIVFK